MEVMEEGNLMDRIPILIQRDMQYYQQKQTVLQESICPGVVGGKLDFPRSASFAAVKVVTWWEEEFLAAYRRGSGLVHSLRGPDCDTGENADGRTDGKLGGCGGIVRASDPEKFVNLITKSADQLLEHLHTLSQEALDHADLTVLTATIGAAALIRNCLTCYLQSVTKASYPAKSGEPAGSLKVSYKQYCEMAEALAERLLDLHCRLLALYILQDAECLHWESTQPFFESERGSYVVQMWWLYMQGTKQDLWNTLPPLMAQRVFSGMLNETLSILTVRYTQTTPSRQRSELLIVDVSNVLLCATELFPAVCGSGEAYAGLSPTSIGKVARDLHAKCQELMTCLVLRGAPLGILYKVLKKGPNTVGLFKSRTGLPSPWLALTCPQLFPPSSSNQWAGRMLDLSAGVAIALELKVYLAQPQPTWPLLLKLLLMRDCTVASAILHHLMNNLPPPDRFEPTSGEQAASRICSRFLCTHDCPGEPSTASDTTTMDPIGDNNCRVVAAIVYVVLVTGRSTDFRRIVSALDQSNIKDWAACLDRGQVWNQKRPPWLESILNIVYPVTPPIAQSLITAVKNGASMYQAMALALSCFCEMWDCLPDALWKISEQLSDIVPAEVHPLGDSVLLQILLMALYTQLITITAEDKSTASQTDESSDVSIAGLLAEAVCYIDEDDKHTQSMEELVRHARGGTLIAVEIPADTEDTFGMSFASTSKIDDSDGRKSSIASSLSETGPSVEHTTYAPEMLVSDVLITSFGKRSLKTMHEYVINNSEWLLQVLGVSEVAVNELEPLPGQRISRETPTLLRTMFHVGHRSFDQLLTGAWRLDWAVLLQTPMSLSPERAWGHVSRRWEFREGATLSLPEAAMVAHITKLLKP